MGANHHKITRQKYNEFKPRLKSPGDDAKISKKSGYGVSTLRMIRNTRDYNEYLARRFRYDGYPRKGKTLSRQTETNADRDIRETANLDYTRLAYWEKLEKELLEIALDTARECESHMDQEHKELENEYHILRLKLEQTERDNNIMLLIGILLGMVLTWLIAEILARCQ